MKIKIEEKVIREIDVPAYSCWTDGDIYVKVIEDGTSIVAQDWKHSKTYSIDKRHYIPDITGFKEITSQEFNKKINEIKLRLC